MTLITEFRDLVSRVQVTPEDPDLKKAVVELVPAMKALADNGNAMAGYYLAKSQPESSNKYQQLMQQSAKAGFGYAMLEMCRLLLRSNDAVDLQEAADYVRDISCGKDSFIKSRTRQLIAEHPALQKILSAPSTGIMQRFFPAKTAPAPAGEVVIAPSLS